MKLIHFEGNVEIKHSVAFPRLLIHCLWPFLLVNLGFDILENDSFNGFMNYLLLGYCICLLCVMKEDILFYKLYRIIKELEKC